MTPWNSLLKIQNMATTEENTEEHSYIWELIQYWSKYTLCSLDKVDFSLLSPYDTFLMSTPRLWWPLSEIRVRESWLQYKTHGRCQF